MQPLRRADGPRRPLFLHPDNYCQKVLDAKIETFEAKNYFTAMPRARKGLLKGELILKVSVRLTGKALYGNPTAAIRGDAGGFLTRKQPGQKSVAEKTNVDADSFTLYSVVATAALVRFYVTSEPTWSDTDGRWDVNDFVNGLLKSMRQKPNWAMKLRSW
ncbi:uncharacterized protein BXZ73DRAFT_74570 [Epithele typhae]|uniref:uncharacterized protein n=1 Tax=Epithele typhae TaxID=378194 RepID=UPI0020074F9A|nr:uncharacterized protein BXZ73DRAFT_85192 [Epithele typhae]XP_047881542.1 uncharacterized protein BXZ73DRAFT_74570 [Epithele typhae]KAH9905507.1 hypothetical protein BXZ73DRAFT_85192 [Epithele typhae]KAH9942284.1 hypothetical protein BXZ73DRAFT_74570 [Epithele typhae]